MTRTADIDGQQPRPLSPTTMTDADDPFRPRPRPRPPTMVSTVSMVVGPCQQQTRCGYLIGRLPVTMADDKANDNRDLQDHGDKTGRDDEVRVIDGGSPNQMAGSP